MLFGCFFHNFAQPLCLMYPYVLSHYGIAETYDNYVETTGTSSAG